MDELSVFRRRVTEARAWCMPRASAAHPAQSLRSPLLRPGFFTQREGRLRHHWGTLVERIAVVDTLAARRAELLRLEDQSYTTDAGALTTGGRLLLYYPDVNLYDGAAEVESQGYFDVDNTPPWDTWVYYVHDDAWQRHLADRFRPESRHGPLDHEPSYASYLVSWVAPQFVELVNAALWANAEQCIRWADDVDTAFTRQLREVGLLSLLTW